MDKLVSLVEEWSKNKGLDNAESSKQFSMIAGFPRHIISSEGVVIMLSYSDESGHTRIPKIIKSHMTEDGYEAVRLNYKDKSKLVKVHRLVAEAFIPNIYNKDTVNHKDGNKSNNRVDNLEWADRSEQMYHAYSLGLKKSSPVAKVLTKVTNGRPVKCFEKETGETKYFLSARDCSSHYGYSPRWCDKLISGSKGETHSFKIAYTTLDEVKDNIDKVSLATLVNLVELWSIDKSLHETESSKQFLKTVEEVGEVAGALARGDKEELTDGIGDVFVTLIILAQQNGLTAEECLTQAYNVIAKRKGKMINGVFVKEEDLK